MRPQRAGEDKKRTVALALNSLVRSTSSTGQSVPIIRVHAPYLPPLDVVMVRFRGFLGAFWGWFSFPTAGKARVDCADIVESSGSDGGTTAGDGGKKESNEPVTWSDRHSITRRKLPRLRRVFLSTRHGLETRGDNSDLGAEACGLSALWFESRDSFRFRNLLFSLDCFLPKY